MDVSFFYTNGLYILSILAPVFCGGDNRRIKLYTQCRDRPCGVGFYCYEGDFSCQPCKNICDYADIPECQNQCKGTTSTTTSKPNPKTTPPRGVSPTAIPPPAGQSENNSQKTEFSINGNVRDGQDTNVQNTNTSHEDGEYSDQDFLQVIALIAVSALAMVVVLILVAVVLKHLLCKRHNQYENRKEITPLVSSEKPSAASLSPLYVTENETETSNRRKTRHTSTSTCSTDIENESTRELIESTLRHVSTSTTDFDANSVNPTAILTRSGNNPIPNIPEEDYLRKSASCDHEQDEQTVEKCSKS